MPFLSSGGILFVMMGRPSYICIASPLMISPLNCVASSTASYASDKPSGMHCWSHLRESIPVICPFLLRRLSSPAGGTAGWKAWVCSVPSGRWNETFISIFKDPRGIECTVDWMEIGGESFKGHGAKSVNQQSEALDIRRGDGGQLVTAL